MAKKVKKFRSKFLQSRCNWTFTIPFVVRVRDINSAVLTSFSTVLTSFRRSKPNPLESENTRKCFKFLKVVYLFKSVIKKPIVPSDKEIIENPPSRSAKLRYVIKKEDFFDFETDILDKFKHLIDIENLSKKL